MGQEALRRRRSETKTEEVRKDRIERAASQIAELCLSMRWMARVLGEVVEGGEKLKEVLANAHTDDEIVQALKNNKVYCDQLNWAVSLGAQASWDLDADLGKAHRLLNRLLQPDGLLK